MFSTFKRKHNKTLTFSMVVQACLSGVVKQSGSGPPSRQMFDSISIRTESPKPRGLVAWSEKYLKRKQRSERQRHLMKSLVKTQMQCKFKGNLKKLLKDLYLKMRLKWRLRESEPRFAVLRRCTFDLVTFGFTFHYDGSSSVSSLWVNLTSLILINN